MAVTGAIAGLVALLCAAACTRRMWLVSNASAWHPALVVAALGRAPDRARLAWLREVAAGDPTAVWERDLLDAALEPDAEARAALVNEQLGELDRRAHDWSSVPPICARITMSVAFLLAALVLRDGLAQATDFSEEAMKALVGEGLTVVLFGFVGTSFAIAANRHARATTRARLALVDALLEKIERATESPEPSSSTPDPA